MAFTRAQASKLLNQAEMGLYDDSRANALRRFGASDVSRRLERARKARTRATDLVQRKAIKARAAGGSKRGDLAIGDARGQQKVELLEDILQRFEGRLALARDAESAAEDQAGTRAPARRGAKAGAAKPARSSKPRPASPARTASRQATKPAGKPSAEVAGAKVRGAARAGGAGTGPSGKAAARKALASTQELLRRKQLVQRASTAGRPTPGTQQASSGGPGFVSGQAKDRALELHAGEIRLAPIGGSIGTRNRKAQGKRDSR